MELAENCLVENPYRKGEFERVTKNIRESSLAAMHARGQIDDAQLRAGEWYRATFELTRRSSGAVDPSNEPVDTSGIADPYPERFLAAIQALGAAKAELGRVGAMIVENVCGIGLTVSEVASRINGGIRSEMTERYLGRLLRDHLDVLAAWKGFAGKPRGLK